ncbi:MULTISPECIES: rhomboid family intramembrane serine protease [Myroides]|uniref:Rhomboid family intramembrane serine protease n=1 Tax=Myroides albus TaxID=2562892 RepID=A0A6I3LSQ6_9FLAO|nr:MULTISPECIES: rhomboid family intramembrane serine protease [Myroides]MTG99025.1 rhomboid family intramembrane serine protease [Myroides albus]MVX34485.1 rhomboid family intramembrane serine protease [Myroides sp. LoEW2-1]UVD80435.1 rhomboid family intramembrane serine protease [Myroides albus]
MANVLDDLKNSYKKGGIAQKLIFWNIGVSLVFFVFQGLFPEVYNKVFYWFVLTDDVKGLLFKPWTLLTYSFIHAGIVHLILNMILLYFVNQLFATFFSQKQFVTTYLLGALVGGLFFCLFGLIFVHAGNVLVGASAAIIAPLLALVTFNPHMEVRLLLIGTVKIWYIAAFIVLIDVLQLMGSSNVGGHLAHLGGAGIGAVYAIMLKRGTDLSAIFDNVVNLFRKKQGTKFKKVYVNKNKEKSVKNDTNADVQQKIDAILDKISKSGYESLTKEEKSFLFKAGKE